MNDLISRQAAIDEITEYGSGYALYMSVGELKRRIEHLPSAQPKLCKDAVSKVEVLETYADLYDVFDDSKKIRKELSKVYDRLNSLPPAQPEPQWIPCSERLPDKTDDYLCSYSGCAVADICEYDPDRNEWGFFYDGGWKVVSNVTAWMPLPEPYAERRQE